MSIPMVLKVAEEVSKARPDNVTATLIGLGTVFVGLICIILLCKLVGAFFTMSEKKAQVSEAAPVAHQATAVEIPNRGETVAAIATAIAEATGSDISAIRILSIEKM